MANVEIKLTGFKELEQKLREFGPKVAKNGLRTSDYAGAKVIAAAAQEITPKKTGLLQANIYPSRRRTPDNVAMYTIIVRKRVVKFAPIARRADTSKNRRAGSVGKYHQIAPPSVYGVFQEFGTSKTPAKHYLRDAFLGNVDNALEQIKGGLATAVDRAAKR